MVEQVQSHAGTAVVEKIDILQKSNQDWEEKSMIMQPLQKIIHFEIQRFRQGRACAVTGE